MSSAWTDRDVMELRVSYGAAAGGPVQLDWLAKKLNKTVDEIERKATDLCLKNPIDKRVVTQPETPAATIVATPSTSTKVNHVHGMAKKGKRADLENRFFRSRAEANYARYLNMLVSQKKISSWEYEPRTFWFEKIKRGTRSYTPDFKLISPDGSYEWHEVKGWMNPQSRTRLKRMAKYFPAEKIVVIDSGWFSSAVRNGIAAMIPTWEFSESTRG